MALRRASKVFEPTRAGRRRRPHARAGLPLNDWLNAVILQQATKQGIKPPSQTRLDDGRVSDELSDVRLRLDDLGRRIDQVTRSGTAAYAPRRSRDDADPLGEQFTRLEQRIDQLASHITRASATEMPSKHALEFAIAEIAARRRFDKADRAPSQDLTGLEDQLRRITAQIETLRRPGLEEAISGLRSELTEIGQTLNEAMPRQAIELIRETDLGLGLQYRGRSASRHRRQCFGWD